MFGWIPLVLYLFIRLPARQAVIVSFIGAWLFLPQADFVLPGLPNYTKITATCYGVLLATIIFDASRFGSFRLRWLDLPMLIWCLCPFLSSISNQLGGYDGVAAVLYQTITWGVPYYLGRLYLGNLIGLKKLAIGIFIGGLVYVPLCLFEVKMSPQLHRIVYGYHPHFFAQTIRYGGFRPTVFMEHGLMVGAWMMAAALIGVWLWHTKVINQVWGIPLELLVSVLLFTVVLVKSTGAWFLLSIGILILFVTKWFRNTALVLLVIVTMSSYLFMGMTGALSSQQRSEIVSVAAEMTNPERAQSLEFRLDNEEILSDKARQRMIFGWGGWGRSRVYSNYDGRDISVTDSLWIIAFGSNGAVGLISLTTSMLLPVVVFLRRYPARLWFHRSVAPAASLAVLLTLYMLDCILNAMTNPIYMVVCGGIAGVALQPNKVAR